MKIDILMFFLLCLLVGFPLSYKILISVRDFTSETRYINRKFRNTENEAKRKYWKRRKCIHYLRLLPFVNRKNAYKVYSFLHRNNEKEQ